MLLEGLHIPLTTPFHPDGRLHAHKLAANVIRYSKSPAQVLIALAPHSGEPTLLDDTETVEALGAVAESAAPEKVLLAHVSRDSVRTTLALAERAHQLAYDAVLVARPSVLGKALDPELLTYFQAVADRSPLPVVVFGTDHGRYALASAVLSKLGSHPNVLGAMWDSSCDENAPQFSKVTQTLAALDRVQRTVTVTPTFAAVTTRMQRAADNARQPNAGFVSATALAHNPAAAATSVAEAPSQPVLKTRTRQVGFQLITVGSRRFVSDLGAGVVGIAPALAACAPQACYEVYAAWKDGDHALAFEKQERLRSAAEYVRTLGPAALKFGCDLNGYFGGSPRLPHLPLTAEHRATLQQHMASLRT